MKKTKHSEEKIIGAVKQMEAGRSAKEIARELGVTDQTLYNWKAKFGGMEVSDAKKLRALEDANRAGSNGGWLSLDGSPGAGVEKTAGACEWEAGRDAGDARSIG